MRDTTHTTQVISPFGSGYVPEARGGAPSFLQQKTSGAAKWTALVVGVLVFGITTATAITKARYSAPDFAWSQPSNFAKSPFMGGFEEALY